MPESDRVLIALCWAGVRSAMRSLAKGRLR